jgi:hypothetical protein
MHNAGDWGALAFGIVVGWVTYRTLARKTGGAQISDLASVIGAVGGAAITTVYGTQHLFGVYAIGLFVGFFAWLLIFGLLRGKAAASVVMGEDGLDGAGPRRFGGGDA